MSIRMLYQKDPTKMTIEELRTMCEFAAGGGGQHGFPDTTWAEKPPGRYCALCMTHHDESAFSAEDVATTEVISCQRSQQELKEWNDDINAAKLGRQIRRKIRRDRKKFNTHSEFYCIDCKHGVSPSNFFPHERKRAEMSENTRCKKHYLAHIVYSSSPRWYCIKCHKTRGIQYFPLTGILDNDMRTYTIGNVCCDCDLDTFRRTNIAAKTIRTQTGIPVPFHKRSRHATWHCPGCGKRLLLHRFAWIKLFRIDAIILPEVCRKCVPKRSLIK